MSIAVLKKAYTSKGPLVYPFTLITGSEWTTQIIEDSGHRLLESVTVATSGISPSKGVAGFLVHAQSDTDYQVSCSGTITIKLKSDAIGKIANLYAQFYGTGRSGTCYFTITHGNNTIYSTSAASGEDPSRNYDSSFEITDDTIVISSRWTGYSSQWSPDCRAYVANLAIDET